MSSLPHLVAGMVPLSLKKRACFVIEVMDSYLRFLQHQSGRLGIRAHPWIMRCRIKSQLLDRFADFAFHGGHLIVLLGRNTYALKELCSSGFFFPLLNVKILYFTKSYTLSPVP
jgi:hypothetical protein